MRNASTEFQGIRLLARDLEEDAPFDEDAAAVLEGTDGDPRKIRANVSHIGTANMGLLMSV